MQKLADISKFESFGAVNCSGDVTVFNDDILETIRKRSVADLIGGQTKTKGDVLDTLAERGRRSLTEVPAESKSYDKKNEQATTAYCTMLTLAEELGKLASKFAAKYEASADEGVLGGRYEWPASEMGERAKALVAAYTRYKRYADKRALETAPIHKVSRHTYI